MHAHITNRANSVLRINARHFSACGVWLTSSAPFPHALTISLCIPVYSSVSYIAVVFDHGQIICSCSISNFVATQKGWQIVRNENIICTYGEVKKGRPGFLLFKCPLKGVSQYLEMSVVIGFEKATMHIGKYINNNVSLHCWYKEVLQCA